MYQIGFFSCINPSMSWLPGDPSEPRCEYSGQVWYFAADANGNRISNYFRSENEVKQAMGGLPSFNMESLQLAKKADYLQNSNAVWASQEVYNSELSETQTEINTFNNEIKNQTQTEEKKSQTKGLNVWYIVLPIVILILFLLKRGGK